MKLKDTQDFFHYLDEAIKTVQEDAFKYRHFDWAKNKCDIEIRVLQKVRVAAEQFLKEDTE